MSVGGAFGAICVRPGMPVSSAWTMSVRSFSGTLSPGNRMLMTLASSGESTYLPKFFRSSLGCVALKKSFLPSGITTSLTSGLPRRLTWTSLGLAPGLAVRRRACGAP